MLTPIPLTLAQANEFVEKHHRHHRRVQGHKFSIGCESCGELVGVVIAGRPVSRYLDDGFTLEVTRLCTLGGRNVCSFLYAAAARTAKAMGYRKIITYTLDTENGASGMDLRRPCRWKALDRDAQAQNSPGTGADEIPL